MAVTQGKQVIYKYSLGKGPTFMGKIIDMPFGAHILDVQMQNENITLWAVVEENSIDIRPRTFIVLGTGDNFPRERAFEHIGTVQDELGYVWHIFEEPRY